MWWRRPGFRQTASTSLDRGDGDQAMKELNKFGIVHDRDSFVGAMKSRKIVRSGTDRLEAIHICRQIAHESGIRARDDQTWGDNRVGHGLPDRSIDQVKGLAVRWGYRRRFPPFAELGNGNGGIGDYGAGV